MVPRTEICTVTQQALLNNAPLSGGLSNTLCKQSRLIFAPSCETFWDLFSVWLFAHHQDLILVIPKIGSDQLQRLFLNNVVLK